jgi:hypothetical protein
MIPRVDNIGFSEIVIEHFGRAGLLAEGFGGREMFLPVHVTPAAYWKGRHPSGLNAWLEHAQLSGCLSKARRPARQQAASRAVARLLRLRRRNQLAAIRGHPGPRNRRDTLP